MILKSIYWFRNNLRLRDNLSLVQAIEESECILPVYILNENLDGQNPLGFANCGPFRRKFLLESLLDLKENLQSLGSDLQILHGNPVKELLSLAEKHAIKDIYGTRELDYNELQEEKELSKLLNLHLSYDQLLLDPDLLPFQLNDLPLIFTQFRKTIEKDLKIRQEISAPSVINTFAFDLTQSFSLDIPKISPSPNAAFKQAGGEKHGWSRLNNYIWETKKLKYYKNTRNGLIGQDYSSKFSPHMAIGCISPVSIYHQVKSFEKEHIKNISTYWLIFEILWREFFKLTSARYGKKIFSKNGITGKDKIVSKDLHEFNRWMNGQTDDDFVNANMIELKKTGFMSNRGRQNVASYLVHDLNIDWRWGASYFESQLVDYDCASNWCNWMYVAGVGNDPKSRKFNIRLQAEKYDTIGKYRNLWLQPQLFG